MSATPPGPLVRWNYLDSPPGPYDPHADPNNPSYDPTQVLPGAASSSYGDAAVEQEQYQRPSDRLHGMGLHGAGVALGMQIKCTTGSPNVTILPGLALDAAGRHIYLANGGQAEIGPNANVPGTPPDSAPVSATGVTLPTAGYTGAQLVIVQWWETWDSASNTSNPNVNQYLDTPWLQLLPESGYNPDLHVILGKVTLDGSSNVTAASCGDPGTVHQRSSISIPAQTVQLKRAINNAAGADTANWGQVRARESGGVEIAVAKSGDDVNVLCDAGGNFSTFGVGANNATVGELANPGIRLDGSHATIVVGAPGNYGDVLVYDGNGHIAVSLIGDTGHLIVGGHTLPGKVRMLDKNANDTMTLDGHTGSAVVQRIDAFNGSYVDVDNNVRIHGTDLCIDGRSGHNKRALVDWVKDTLAINFAGDYRNGVEVMSSLKVDGDLDVDGTLSAGGNVLMGNPARLTESVTLFAGSSYPGVAPVDTQDVDLGSAKQLTAIVASFFLQAYVSVTYDAACAADVFQVDGQNTAQRATSGDLSSPVMSPTFKGVRRVITFRAIAGNDSIALGAYGIVFHE